MKKTTLKEVTWKRHLTDTIEEVLQLRIDTYDNNKNAVEVAKHHLEKAEAEYAEVEARTKELSSKSHRGTRREHAFNKYIDRKLDKYDNFIRVIFVTVSSMALVESVNGLLSNINLNPFRVGKPIFFLMLVTLYFVCGLFGLYRNIRSLILLSQGMTKKEDQEYCQLMIKSAELWTKTHELQEWLHHEELRGDFIKFIQEVEDEEKRRRQDS